MSDQKSCYSSDVNIANPEIPSKRLLVMVRDSLCYEYQGCTFCPIGVHGECCPFNKIIDDLRMHE